MKKIKCISCGEFWFIDETDEKIVRYCPYCGAKEIGENDAAINLPGFLVKPNDPFSEHFFGSEMITVCDRRCNYQIELYGPSASEKSYIKKKETPFEIDEVHIYSAETAPSWYAVSIMKSPEVRTSSLENMVLSPYNLFKMLNVPEVFLNIPEGRLMEDCQSMILHHLGAWQEYDKIHHLDESVAFCHVFLLNGKMYKDYILCARKDIYAWRLECFIESQNENPQIDDIDFVPPGYMFGSFYPIV